MKTTRSPIRDRELVQLLAEEPELLAFADAIATSQATAAARPAGRHRLLIAAALSCAAVLGTLALIAPWRGAGSLTDRALAAVGQGPVLHVVTERPAPDWYRTVDLATGNPVRVMFREEVWFDQSRDLKRTVSIANGTAFSEILETPQGGFTSTGPLFTCAWIAAHPVEATKARVSCNANMANGTSPRSIPGQPPTFDLALAGFVDHYRSALASGQATETGRGELDGHEVIWLRITTSQTGANGMPLTEDVAIDASSYTPLLVRTGTDHAVEVRVTQIESEPYTAALFRKPALTHPPSSGEVAGRGEIDAADAPALLGGRALWLGRAWNDFRLVRVERQDLTTGYGTLSGLKPTHSIGVSFEYARVKPNGAVADEPSLLIREATECETAYGMICDAQAPSGNTMLVGLPTGSMLRRDGLYLSISTPSPLSDPVAVAHALQPLRG
jgi:hypothetical protein